MTCTRASIAIALSLMLLIAIFVLIMVQEGSQSPGQKGPSSHLRPIHSENENAENENHSNAGKDVPSLLWSDEFDGDELNPQYWLYDTTKSLLEQQQQNENQLQDDIKLDPVNMDFEYYDSHAVVVKDGLLTISTQQVINAAVPFVSGRIKTQEKVMFQYGTIEARIRIRSSCEPGVDVCVSSRNLSPSLWTRGNGSTSFGEPTMGQVDIFTASIPKRRRALANGHRMLSSSIPTQSILLDSQLEANANGIEKDLDLDHSWNGHSGATWITSDPNSDSERLIKKSMHDDFPIENWMNQDFQIYTFDWTPTRMATYIDDELVFEMDITDGSCGDCQDFHRPHYLLLAITVLDSPSWALSSSSTLDLTVDYIHLLDNGFAKVSTMPDETRRQL
ncbi:unnamed protein product [Cylindrotheca closterium]|uniref:GH16 domain-containing protein n=1 Tax=Cylindrotheca closterium TaxID=2856 RepID=A0AAD2FL61_9STRA|nr:unnamed protein product [Cylindrotheca closterium]